MIGDCTDLYYKKPNRYIQIIISYILKGPLLLFTIPICRGLKPVAVPGMFILLRPFAKTKSFPATPCALVSTTAPDLTVWHPPIEKNRHLENPGNVKYSKYSICEYHIVITCY
jgi:hypothetical protein